MCKEIDVLFIHPRNFGIGQKYLKLPSLELCHMSSVLNENNYSNLLLDFNIENIGLDSIEEYLIQYNPKIILIYGTENNHINALETAKIAKKLFSKSLIGINGMIVTFIDKYILEKYTFIDFVLKHDADYVLKFMLDNKCSLELCSNINNLSYKIDDKIFSNECNQNYELNKLPTANRELYNLKKYYLYSSEAILRSSRGCPSKCDFCNKTVYSKFKVFSMEHFFKEIDLLLKNGYTSFFFSDDTFAFSMQRLNEFCELYKKGGYSFKWTSNLRVSDITDDLIKKMKDHGAYRVFIGIETINKESNLLVNKSQNVLNTREKISILKKNDIEFHASFIVGNPGDTKQDLENTIEFVKEIKPTLATFNMLKLFPGTKIFENPEKYGIIPEDLFWFENNDWIKRPLVSTKNLSAEDIEFYARKMMKDMVLYG